MKMQYKSGAGSRGAVLGFTATYDGHQEKGACAPYLLSWSDSSDRNQGMRMKMWPELSACSLLQCFAPWTNEQV